jgi:hypothetical protein
MLWFPLDIELADRRATDKWRTGYAPLYPRIIASGIRKAHEHKGLALFDRSAVRGIWLVSKSVSAAPAFSASPARRDPSLLSAMTQKKF